jgi:hypothetical protein
MQINKLKAIKWYTYLGAIILLLVLLFESKGENGDLTIFLDASRDLMQGENIYTNTYNEWYHYYYDTLFALLLVPFTFLPLFLVKFIWLSLNVFFVVRIWKIITGWLPINQLSSKQKTIFTLLSFLFILAFLRDNFHLTQVTIFILYLTLEGLHFIERGKKLTGSLLIAFAITVKLLPLVFIPYLLYRKEWKAFGSVCILIVVLLLIPGLIIGLDYNHFLILERWKLLNPTNTAHVLDTSERSFHSISTLFSTLFVAESGDIYALPYRRHLLDLPLETLSTLINAARLLFVGATLYFLASKPFQPAKSNLQKLYEISYICLIIPLIFPHQQHYAFFFIFPASSYLLFYFTRIYVNNQTKAQDQPSRKNKMMMIILLSLVYLMTNGHFILGTFNPILEHYKILTYSVFILCGMLAYYSPTKLDRKINNSVS